MNSLERIEASIGFQTPDRIPVVAQVFGHAAVLSSLALGDYVRDGSLLARCQIEALEYYGHDAVFALMDVNVEAEAVGSILDYRPDIYPAVMSCALSDITELAGLTVPDPRHSGRMPELLKAVGILRKEVGRDILVVGCVVGPMTLTVNLMGAERALYLAVDDPEQFSRLLSFSTRVIIDFGVAQIKAGAHLPLVFDPSASPAFIPPQFFREFELPLLQKIFTAFKQNGALANWLHIAGPIESILPFYPRADVDIANLDYGVNPGEARQILPLTCLNGNIKPLSFVQGTPDDIARESKALLDMFAGKGGFILSSGCEIPPESKPENIAAMVKATREMNGFF